MKLHIEMNAWVLYFLFFIFGVYGTSELRVWPMVMNRDHSHFDAQTKQYLRGPKTSTFLGESERNGNLLY